ncbi:hypothetical protein ACIQ7Q_14555 [Streptomyces sp. NPDC096176]|uniref:hypothetical protein n=1 Tax=Streptomyces sp. NPDC096176 TaxID=3366079 RepID=UPI003806EE32
MRRTLRTAAVLAALLPLTACGIGIQETDVIEAGGPATIDVLPAREVRMLLFFLSPDGVLSPVPRIVENEGGAFDSGLGGGYTRSEAAVPVRPATEKVVAALLAGPNEAERRAGLRNAAGMPAPTVMKKITVSGGVAEAFVPARLAGMPDLAKRQLVCTIAYAESAQGTIQVRLTGVDGALTPAYCDARSAAAPTTTADQVVPPPAVSPAAGTTPSQ